MNDIYINARFLTQPVTGVQRFASEISKQLQILLPHAKFISPHNVIQHELANTLKVKKLGRFTGHLWEQTELPTFLKKNGSPLLVNLGNTGPVLYSNSIVTIHDLSFLMFPKAYSKKFYLVYKHLIPTIIRKSKKVITVSEGAKSKIVEMLKVPAEKIEVVYNAATHLSLRVNEQSDKSSLGRYLLCVASFNPIKNLGALMEAFGNIEDKEIKLVVAGAKQKSFSDQAFNGLDSDKVIFTGHIEDQAELISLYRNATAFVFPSLYESFGIPTLEAMLCGCPVIASNAGSLPEICGNAALYIDPYNVESITEKINVLLKDSMMRQQLINNGYQRAKFFNWRTSAEKLTSIIDSK